jgi:hypothetical protein
MAQVSSCNHVLCKDDTAASGSRYEGGRDKIRLGLGALRSQKSVWEMAGRSVREVVGVARDLLGVLSMDVGANNIGESDTMVQESFANFLDDEALVLVDSGSSGDGEDLRYLNFSTVGDGV